MITTGKNTTEKKINLCIYSFILLLIFFFSPYFYTQVNAPKINIHQAVLQNNIEQIKQNIEYGTNLNQRDGFGSTPLLIAATFGKTDAAKLLIEAGVDLHIADKYGSTPLHLAVYFGYTNLVETLLENGADKYLRNINGAAPYDIAASPFEYDKAMYDQLSTSLAPLGFKLDYELIKAERPKIAEMLKPGSQELDKVNYEPFQGEDWKISTPEKQGVDPRLISELYLDASHLETIYGVLVLKNGFLIAEKYFNEGSIDQLDKRASVTKSYTSALLGIALDKGYLESVNQKMIDFFPEVADKIKDERKKQITLQQMLQMRAGYPWEETDTTYWNALWSGKYINDIVEFPLTQNPGTEFQYSNLTSNWLAIIISKSTKTDLKTFGEKYLFEPLNVKVGDWTRDADGYYIGSGDIQFTMRDMAKFGQLYLDKGKYNNKELISEDWINQSFKNYTKEINSAGIKKSRVGRYFENIGYGYQWWTATTGNHKFNLAWGHGGQFIILLHDLNMVIVTTADPFYGKKEHFNGWKHEQSVINVIGKFIKSLPSEF